METALRKIRQHVQEAQKYAVELLELCRQAGDSDDVNRADDIELALRWTDKKAEDFQATRRPE